MRDFVFPGLTQRVLFGAGTLSQVGAEIDRMGHDTALVLTTPEQEEDGRGLARDLNNRAAGHFAGATMHTPVAVTETALAAFRSSGASCVVCLGGGSTIGLGKAIAARTGADQIAIPTSYAGSEMTDILGETKDGNKTTRRDPSIRPETVIYDVDLTLSLPAEMTVTSALNAIAHAVEALYAPDRNPIIELMAIEACEVFARALPQVVKSPGDTDARAEVLYAAWLCSTALGHVSMALHHKLAHVIGGSFDMPHAATHAILLPHTAGFNAGAVPDALAPVARAFGAATPGPALHRFAASLGAPLKLADLGLSEADLDRAAEIAVANPYDNPRAFDQQQIRALLQQAWEGSEPSLE